MTDRHRPIRAKRPAPAQKSPPSTAGDEQKPPELVYGSAEEFLHEQLLPTYVRDVDGRAAKWCIEWYFHPEAVSRVEALWRAWEHLRLDGATGISVWWQRPRRPPHERAPGPTRPVLQMRHAKNTATPNTWNQKRHPNGWFPDVRVQER